MTPRITKEGNSVTVAEPSEYERLREALSISVQRAISLNPSESTNILIGVWRDLEEAHPAVARAIRDGIERARKPVSAANMLVGGVVAKVTEFSDGTFEFSDNAVSEHLFGPGAERFVFTDRAREQDSTNAPPPEDLSALKKRIGWDRERAKRVLFFVVNGQCRHIDARPNAFERGEINGLAWDLFDAGALKNNNNQEFQAILQALLDHEDEE